MKTQNNERKTSFLKKIFVKICRIFGYEIIDQGSFFVPTQNKLLDENLSIHGKKSINLPLGEIKISRKVNTLTVIFRSCTNVNMLTQNKKRLFECQKSEYTFRSLNSITSSLNLAKKYFPQVEFEIIIIDYKSEKSDLDKMNKILNKSNVKNSIISLDIDEFRDKIKKINAKKANVTENQISNMCNIYKSLMVAKNKCKDLIYFVEDDYIHLNDAIQEMLFTYERISSQLDKELILCPSDYPYLYNKIVNTEIFLGHKKHWRKVDETLCTFLTSTQIVTKYWNKFISMCEFEHYPFEEPLHDIYDLEYCLSPIPSLALHCTNVNSIFGLSPNINWKETWEENKNY